jgi:AraC family transcriptional regulator of adaptative response / DNA-3-methyladenine glycosylase II
MMPDPDSCYAAMVARDVRFDGVFFVGVSTTGVYCRPVCTARTPRRDRCWFYRLAAEAEKAGYRACFRCRPELAPGGASIDAVPRLVSRALQRIEQGYLNDHGVAALAADLGVTDRHLRRALEDELGLSPVEIAQSRRLAVAKQLLADTALSVTEVAFASGFRSVRRFNDLFARSFGRAPSSLRRPSPGPLRGAASGAGAFPLCLRLDFRPPFDWDDLLAFLGQRAIPGVEAVADGEYRRVVRLGARIGVLRVRPDPRRASLRVLLTPSLSRDLMTVALQVRALFDLDARPAAIDARLGRDHRLAPLVARRPGLRVPGAFDPFETVVRALLGQQVTVRAATTLAGRLVARFGRALTPEAAAPLLPGLTHAFPSPAEVASVAVEALASIGLPRTRAATLRAVAVDFATTPAAARAGRADPDDLPRRLRAIPGIGDWTVAYVAMRALHDPDALPAGDLALRRALGGMAPGAVRERAAAWSPWRAYAVMHLWTAQADAPAGTSADAGDVANLSSRIARLAGAARASEAQEGDQP